MLGSLLSSGLKLRLAVWAAEQALPSSSDLKIRLRAGLLGIGAAIAGGVLMALTFAAVMVAGFFVLKGEGIAPYHAAGCMIGITIIVVLLLICLARQYLATVTADLRQQREWFDKFGPARTPESGLVEEVLSGFVAGLLGKGKTPPKPKTPKEPQVRILRHPAAERAQRKADKQARKTTPGV